jgi:small subunit ribosomal protein S13
VARVAGVDLPRDKRLEIGLTYIFGVGPTRARTILKGSMVDGDKRVSDLTEDEVMRLRGYIEGNFQVEGDLRREVAQNIKRKVEIGCYQGIRHRRSLPVHGQRTHTNGRTRKGPKKTVGVKRKKGK